MKRAQIERLSVRTALALGFCVHARPLALHRLRVHAAHRAVQRDAAEVAARYTRAQELLSTVRAQVLLSSVRVRDALLDPEPAAVRAYREQIEASSHAIISMALADYEPVLGAGCRSDQIDQLRDEVEQFHATSMRRAGRRGGHEPGGRSATS